jgi:hypothetical protein
MLYLYLSDATGEERHHMWDGDKRFERIYRQGSMSIMEIWVDTTTGVQYLFHCAGYSGGLSVLLDAEGKPVLDSRYTR